MWRGVERGNTASFLLLLVKNDESWTMEGMFWNPGLSTTVLSAVTVVSLSLVSLLCLRCKRKSKIIHEEHQTNYLQTFQRGGSIFAVVQSKPVARASRITSPTVGFQEDFSVDAYDEQPDYENVKQAPQTRSLDHTYVAPLPSIIYANEQTKNTITDANQTLGVYENFIKSLPIVDDEDDYVNSKIQIRHKEEDDEPDYVNSEA